MYLVVSYHRLALFHKSAESLHNCLLVVICSSTRLATGQQTFSHCVFWAVESQHHVARLDLHACRNFIESHAISLYDRTKSGQKHSEQQITYLLLKHLCLVHSTGEPIDQEHRAI